MGQHLSIDTEFKKGSIPWNKGVKMSEDYALKMRKCSPEQEKIIAKDSRSASILAKEYGVSKKTILNIRKRHKS